MFSVLPYGSFDNEPEMSSKVKIKAIKSPTSKTNLLGICYNNDIKISKVVDVEDGYLAFCSTASDADVLFSSRVQALLSGCSLSCVLPPEVKARRSVIVRGTDNLIYNNEPGEILQEIRTRNSWADVEDVIKFPNSKTLKVQFSSYAGAQKCLTEGLSMFYLHVNSSQMQLDNYIHILTCYKCYALDHHATSKCTKGESFKLCSLCGSDSHVWKQCGASFARCVNCEGSHNTLSMQCPRRRELIKSRRQQQRTSGRSYSEAVVEGTNKLASVDDSPVIARSISCILLALLNSSSGSSMFSSDVNQLFKQNGLPTVNLSNFDIDASLIVKGLFGPNISDVVAQKSGARPSHCTRDPDLTTITQTCFTPTRDSVQVESLAAGPSVNASSVSTAGASPSASSHTAHADASSLTVFQWSDYKCFKTKDTVVQSPAQLLKLYDKGKVAITHGDGNVLDYSTAVKLIKSCPSLPVICDMKPGEFNSFSASPARLRSRAGRK